MDWGGFVNTHVGYADVDLPAGDTRDFDGVNVFVNREIHFTPSVTLDNGLTFGVNVQREADNGSSPNSDIDETFMTISGDTLGRIIIGNENSAGYLAMGSVYTPSVGSMPINSASISGFLPTTGTTYAFRSASLSSLTEVVRNNDVTRITYFTPSFNGLILGASYAPGNTGSAVNAFAFDRDAVVSDIFDVSAQYSQSFNGVDIGLAARYGTGDTNVAGNDDPETWGVGGTVGFSGFSIGATYAENENGAPGNLTDAEGWSFGVSYDLAGPWSIGAETYQGETKTGVATSDEYEAYKIAASRSLGAGVSWDVYAIYAETTNDAANTEIEGTIIATAINLSF